MNHRRELSTRIGLSAGIALLTLSVAGAGLLLTGIAGCGSDDKTETVTADERGARSPGDPLEVGDLAPDFRLERLDGSPLQLSDLRGKAVLIDFWATWCPPCRVAMPDLIQLSRDHADSLVVVGIALDQQGRQVVEPFVEKFGVTFEVVLYDDKVVTDYGNIRSIPTTFLVDPQGRVVGKWVGLASKENYEEAIRVALRG
ncbi:MAG: TlpA disulfide reductase family protein [Candidatus Krumholzibacteriia bacterium]